MGVGEGLKHESFTKQPLYTTLETKLISCSETQSKSLDLKMLLRGQAKEIVRGLTTYANMDDQVER